MHVLATFSCFNDTHMEELVCALMNKFTEIQGWLLLTFFIYLHDQLNVIHQIDCKNEWLVLSVTFTRKIELVFVLTFENAFLKPTERA